MRWEDRAISDRVVSLDDYRRRKIAAWDARHPGTELPPMMGLPLEPRRVRRARAEAQRDEARGEREGSEG